MEQLKTVFRNCGNMGDETENQEPLLCMATSVTAQHDASMRIAALGEFQGQFGFWSAVMQAGHLDRRLKACATPTAWKAVGLLLFKT